MNPTFKLKVRFGGYFLSSDGISYQGGKKVWVKILDPDYFSFFELISILKEASPSLKGIENLRMFYCLPGTALCNGIRMIRSDKEALELAEVATRNGVAEVFVTNPDKNVGGVNPENNAGGDVDDGGDIEDAGYVAENDMNGGDGSEADEVVELNGGDGSETDDGVDMNGETDDGETDDGVGMNGGDGGETDEGVDINGETDERVHPVAETYVGHDSDSEAVLSGGYSSEDDEEWLTSRQLLLEMKRADKEGTHLFDIEEEQEVNRTADSDDEYYYTPPGSDEDGVVRDKERVVYKVDSDANLKTMVWRVGMKFSSADIFKQQVSRYGAVAGYCVTWCTSIRNKKLGAKCKKGCGWKIYASLSGNKELFVVKSVQPTHTCNRQDFQNAQVTPRFLAKEFLSKYKNNPAWPRTALQEEVLQKFGKRISRFTSYTVKKYAHQSLYGSMAEHYNRVGNYMAELERSDPQINLVLVTESGGIPSEPALFKRLYVSFPALREGWARGCRPVICLDGCFLKTYLGGMLLCAVGRDGNNQMYPIAWAVVEAENNSSWSWFLHLLKKDLPGFGGGHCTISSDQQKGLCNAVKEHFPNVEHRNCARHIYANWHKKHKGDELKYLFWRAARAYTKAEYEAALHDMGKVSKTARADFVAKDPTYFCRSHLKTGSRTEVIVNNIAETFNGYIVKARAKPLTDMLDTIRLQMMERMYNRSLLMTNRKEGDLCPRIKLKLDKEKEEARLCEPVRGSESDFQVTHRMDMFSVNIKDKTCSCRKWDLSGIPCCHAVACLDSIRVDVEDFVDDWLKKEMYEQAYSGSIKTARGMKHWPKVNLQLVPPKIKVQAGRPKKNRRKEAHERFDKKGKLSGHGMQMTCRRCGGPDHNKRSCKQPPMASFNAAPQPPKPRGRPRKDGAPPQPRVVDPTQPKRKRGRPAKVVSMAPPRGTPRGMGLLFGPDARTYVNPGQANAYVISQSQSAPGPSQPSQ